MNDYVHSLKKLRLKYGTLPCQERFKFGAGDPVVCKTAYFFPVLIHGTCAIMRVSVVPGKLMLLIGKDTLKILEARFDLKSNIWNFPGAGDLEGQVLRESGANHLMAPLLSESFWEFPDSFASSETVEPWFTRRMTNETFSMKRSPGSRTIRDLMITSGRRSFQRLHRTFRRLRQKRAASNEQESHMEGEKMESDMMDAKGSLHQKSNDVCITEDAESIDFGWFENTKLNRVKNGT